MRFLSTIILAYLALCFVSCKKLSKTPNNCFQSVSTVRFLTNVGATIKANGGEYLLIEQGSIDSRLRPCNLPADFQVDNLSVTVSGEVKLTIQDGPGPCCTEDFVISKISK